MWSLENWWSNPVGNEKLHFVGDLLLTASAAGANAPVMTGVGWTTDNVRTDNSPTWSSEFGTANYVSWK